jgi:hypothetical protein
MGKMRETTPKEAGGYIIDTSQEGKILVFPYTWINEEG